MIRICFREADYWEQLLECWQRRATYYNQKYSSKLDKEYVQYWVQQKVLGLSQLALELKQEFERWGEKSEHCEQLLGFYNWWAW